MFSTSLAAVPLSVMSQIRVKAGISPSQRWTRAVLVCIFRSSVLVDDGGEHACSGCDESRALHSFGMIDRHFLPLILRLASHLDLLYTHFFVNPVSSVITIMLPRFHLLRSSNARSANREGVQLSVALPGRQHAVASRVFGSLKSLF